MRAWWVCLVMVVACKSTSATIDGGAGDASVDDASDASVDDASDASVVDAIAIDASPDAAPAALVIASDYDHFGTVTASGSAPITVTVTNNGGVTTGTLVASVSPTVFSISADTCNVALAPGASCTFRVRFTPTASGTVVATVVVGDGAVSAMKELTADGIYHEYYTVSPSQWDFGEVAIGSTTASITFTLLNAGATTHGPLALTREGATPTSFTIVDDHCSGIQVAPGATCRFGLTFTPSEPGIAISAIRISSNIASAYAVHRGTGLDPKLRVDLASRNFGSTPEGSHGEYTRFEITNVGASASGPLTTTIVGMHPNDFAIATGTNTCETQLLAPGATCSVEVRFSPTANVAAPQDRYARLRVADTTNAAAADLSGRTAPSTVGFAISPTPFSFGDVPVGQSSATQTFVVTNRGASVPFGSVYSRSVFDVSNDTCSNVTLAVNASCSFDVTARPTSLGYVEDSVGSFAYSSLLVRGVP